MLTEQKFYIHLTDADCAKMQDIVQQQCGSPSRILRAKILLYVDSLCTKNLQCPISPQCPTSPQSPLINVREIADLFNVTDNTIRRICSCYRNEGLRTSFYGNRFREKVHLGGNERLILQQILTDSKSYKVNQKIARILLKADHDGNNMDISEISHTTGCTKMTVTKTIRSYTPRPLKIGICFD